MLFSLLTWFYHVVFVVLIFSLLTYITYRLCHTFFPGSSRCSGYALVTGCDTGFGYLTALALSREGIYTFAGCLTQDGVETLEADPAFVGTPVLMDITKQCDIVNMKNIITNKVGDEGLFCLINNAGVCEPGPIEWMSVEDMKRSMDVNLWGTVHVTKQMLPLIKTTKGGGRVVIMSSISGRISDGNFAAYSMTKYALEAFADALRVEMKFWGVSVHIIEPGHHATNLFKHFDERWNDLWQLQPIRVQEEYGEDYRARVLKGTREMMGAFKSNNRDVVDAYLHAALSSKPKARYIVGLDANTAGLLVANLPTSLQDFVKSKLFAQVLPAACKHGNP